MSEPEDVLKAARKRDGLPKGTALDLKVLLKRIYQLRAAQVYVGNHQIKALQRVIAYVSEGKA